MSKMGQLLMEMAEDYQKLNPHASWEEACEEVQNKWIMEVGMCETEEK